MDCKLEQEYVDKVKYHSLQIQKNFTFRIHLLRKEMEASPIMDHKYFVREIRQIYQSMWENYMQKKR